MKYYTVAVADDGYKGHKPLTYASEQALQPGQIVLVPLRKILATGIVTESVVKPKFATKPIAITFNLPPLPAPSLKLLDWLRDFYAAPLGVSTQQFVASSLTERTIANTKNEIATGTAPDTSKLPKLIPEQTVAVDELSDAGAYILHGDTGTGKTRIYIELALKAVKSGRSAIILTPEISLTSQLTESFYAVFGSSVLVTHSGLTTAQRRNIWLACLKTTSPLVVIGPRSALFSPLANIGLIVVDEAHDDAFKQDSVPTYHATRVASQLASLHKAPLVLGSATPSVNDYFMATQKKRPILRLTKRPIDSRPFTTTTLTVDMRERSNFTQNAYISDPLIKAIRLAREKGEQSLIFLNRRGTSRITLCSTCGWRALCDHCGTPMTFHEDSFSLRCHTCAKNNSVPSTCPSCGGGEILFRSMGTKAIESALKSLFPASTVMRFDTDNKKDERFEQHYQNVKTGKIDVLIGTQLLVKGLDLPKLSVVGVLNADLSLQIPDFTAEEKTYQLLSQVIGRIGRGHRSGTAIVQTYNPHNKAIADALSQNWQDFYERELQERKTFLFPPFCHLLVLTVRRASQLSSEKAATKFAYELQRISGLRVEHPVPSYHLKVDGQFEWRIVVKATSRTKLTQVVGLLPSGWRFDIDPSSLL